LGSLVEAGVVLCQWFGFLVWFNTFELKASLCGLNVAIDDLLDGYSLEGGVALFHKFFPQLPNTFDYGLVLYGVGVKDVESFFSGPFEKVSELTPSVGVDAEEGLDFGLLLGVEGCVA
jgi:hypothetical protein